MTPTSELNCISFLDHKLTLLNMTLKIQDLYRKSVRQESRPYEFYLKLLLISFIYI